MSGSRGTTSSAVKNAVSLKPIEVPEALQKGEKFIKWDEDSGMGTPVTLKVDKFGFFLHWTDQKNESDMLDIANIRDTRTGRYAKIPKDPRLRQVVAMGAQADTLEEKTVTVCCASDFVNLVFINFCCTKKDIAQLWTDALMSLAYNLNQVNGTTSFYLLKAHTKLTMMADRSGKIPVKNIIKMFANQRDDKKRLEKALESIGLPYGKNDAVSPEKFEFESFFNLYKNLTQRPEVEQVFCELTEGVKKGNMTIQQIVDFLNKQQRDPRLNEILHPYANSANALEIINQYEPNKSNVQKGLLSFDGFLRYLLSEDNNILSQTTYDLSHDMDQPLPHYFINSSHNTYLTGHQITGRSSVEIYRQCLLAGCRCVELDFWNTRNSDEPVVVHGYTFVPEIPAKEVLEAIAESAFKTSDYPVILSFENHLRPKQQVKLANYCREIFGDMLLEAPLETHKLEPGVALPPPSMLKRKIIIKNKKKHHHHHRGQSRSSPEDYKPEESKGNGEVPHPPPLSQTRQGSKESTGTEDEDSTSEEEEVEGPEVEASVEGVSGLSGDDTQRESETEAEASAEISALVNYVQPVHFSSFESAQKKNRCYEMSSFDERQATTLLKEKPIEFVNYNKHQLSRVYPGGTRFDSSNFMPQLYWNAGCQLVALNFQTLDLAMQLNLGIFEYNQRCGFLLKPEFMRRTDRRLDPFAESTVDGIIAGTVEITVLSGQCLSDKRVGTYVEVDMYGLPADTVRRKFRTRVVSNNGINPVYSDEPFVFKKIVLPELASIRLSAYDDSGRFIGHRVLPVVGLCPGYRHVNLRTELGQPIPMAALFLHIVVKDYVPDDFADFAEALANPIKYQSDLEKRAQQLSVLTDDLDPLADTIEPAPNRNNTSFSNAPPTSNGSPTKPPAIALTAGSLDMSIDNDVPPSSVMMQTSPNLSGSVEHNSLAKVDVKEEKIEEVIVAEPIEKIMENKLVKEKRLECEKKVESMRKKYEKEKKKVTSFHSQKSGELSGEKKSFINIKLVKKLSKPNITSTFSTESPSSEPLTRVIDQQESCTTTEPDKPLIPRSQSERLLAIHKDYLAKERDLRERYHEIIYSAADKVLKQSQANQTKQLKARYDRDTFETMRRLQLKRREEVKALEKKHKDRDELDRIKREVNREVVEKGVMEREKLCKAFQDNLTELERQHETVRNAFAEHKAKAKSMLEKEFEARSSKVDGECSMQEE
ncbi:1-phosphatidylinositol 4,5-bisphosphate phosphodiesterase classes I and II [Onthophagus taurus]|uniref:1-phosphatidylinositol 4,5-bisphosphate phosphodiesterase classes I and II n=1 Tax=Onthophagus taurus TaxID=166361 RepID=UPI000C1FFF3E|nr:1-phosphatidylinositol 4,5-bisphosphate phosphodiesterase classes I and II [Onthophagus taurus]